jgi:hypothetical protein
MCFTDNNERKYMINGRYTQDGGTDVRRCRNCGQPKGQYAAVTSGINDEHWCPNTDGKGFKENHDNISANIFWPVAS